jgi:hypothetical protein
VAAADSVISRITRHGFPAENMPFGMSLVTTLHAPMSVFEPISMDLHESGYFSPIVLSRNALLTTETELKLMAAAANMGLRRR